MKIKKDMIINDVLETFPESKKLFDQYNMGCLGCLGAGADSLEKGALMHGVAINSMVDKLNEIISSKAE